MNILTEAENLANSLEPEKSAHDKQSPEPIKVDRVNLAQETPSPLNDVKDTVNTFMDKIAIAHQHGDPYVEVSPEIFEHYMRGQKTSYFYYQNVRVYKYGTREAIEKDELKNV